MLLYKRRQVCRIPGHIFHIGMPIQISVPEHLRDTINEYLCRFDGLYGQVTQIATGTDKRLKAEGPDITCAMRLPPDPVKAKEILERFPGHQRFPTSVNVPYTIVRPSVCFRRLVAHRETDEEYAVFQNRDLRICATNSRYLATYSEMRSCLKEIPQTPEKLRCFAAVLLTCIGDPTPIKQALSEQISDVAAQLENEALPFLPEGGGKRTD